MTATPSTRRSPAAGAAALIAVLLLFGALTFVAGLAMGDGDGIARQIPRPLRNRRLPALGGRNARSPPTRSSDDHVRRTVRGVRVLCET